MRNFVFALVSMSALVACGKDEFVGSWRVEAITCEGEFAYQNYPGSDSDQEIEQMRFNIEEVDGEYRVSVDGFEDAEDVSCTVEGDTLECGAEAEVDGPLVFTPTDDGLTMETPNSDPCTWTLVEAGE